MITFHSPDTTMRTFATLIAIPLLLLSSMQLRVSMHRCAGKVVHWTVLGDARPCAHAAPAAEPACPLHGGGGEGQRPGCCSDDVILVESMDPVVKEAPQRMAVPATDWLAQPAITLLPVPEILTSGWTLQRLRPPPLVAADLVVRHRSFLI
jgi:hypothetical protein